MRARLLPLLSAAALAVSPAAISGCRPEDPPPGAGEEAGQGGAKRVLSLSPALTRIVLAVGAEQQIVGVDRFSRRIEAVRDRPSLGGLFAPDLERAVELEPDLVLAVASGPQFSFLAQLRARGVRVESFDGHRLDEVLDSFRRIGALLGRADEGEALASRVSRELDELRARSGPERPRVAVVVQLDPLYVVGGGSFVNELIDAAGGRNVFAELEQAYPRVSLEAIAERAPDVLLDTTFDLDAGAKAQQASRAYWGRFHWIQRVEVMAHGILTLPGPDLSAAARELGERIAP